LVGPEGFEPPAKGL